MKQAVIGVVLFAAGAALGTWLGGARAADAATDAKAALASPPSPKPTRYALQAWEGCRPLDAGDAFDGPVTRTLSLSGGNSVEVALVPVTRDNGAVVFDALVKGSAGSVRSQVGFHSPLLAEGVLLRASDLGEVKREVSGDAPHLHGPHPMAK